jgi:hypothetical protein
LFNAEAHSSRRLQSFRAVEHTSHIVAVYVLFVASIRNHNDRKTTIGPFDYQALHHAFSEEVAILSTMEPEQFATPTYRVASNES